MWGDGDGDGDGWKGGKGGGHGYGGDKRGGMGIEGKAGGMGMEWISGGNGEGVRDMQFLRIGKRYNDTFLSIQRTRNMGGCRTGNMLTNSVREMKSCVLVLV